MRIIQLQLCEFITCYKYFCALYNDNNDFFVANIAYDGCLFFFFF